MKDVIIIGSGIAGLSAAFELSKDNLDFQILEPANRVGGKIESFTTSGCQIEGGPYTFTSSSAEILNLIKELDIANKLLEANPDSKKRYVYLNNELIKVPSGLKEFLDTNIISKDAKFTLFEDLLIKKVNEEESVESFISRRFGREILKNLIQPFLNGVFAGDVKKLSANAVFPKLKELEKKYKSILLGSIISGKFKNSKKLTLYSFKDGMETLTNEIYSRVKNKTTLNVENIEIAKAKDFYIVTFKSSNKTISYTTNSVLFAAPAYTLNSFNSVIPKDCLSSLEQIEYAPIASIAQTVDKSNIKNALDGFGYLCTVEPQKKLLGTIWTSSIFPSKAPEDKVLLSSYIGGTHFKKVIDLSEEEIKKIVSKEVGEILNISPEFIETLSIRVHPYAIPQYNMGHREKIKPIEELMKSTIGLFFTGNYLYGISINETIKTSLSVVKQIKEFTNKTKKTLVLTK